MYIYYPYRRDLLQYSIAIAMGFQCVCMYMFCSVTVGATDIDDKKASFSNQGECVDVFAPVSILHVMHMHILSTRAHEYILAHAQSLLT